MAKELVEFSYDRATLVITYSDSSVQKVHDVSPEDFELFVKSEDKMAYIAAHFAT